MFLNSFFFYFLCKFSFFRKNGQGYNLEFFHICSVVFFAFPIKFGVIRCFLKMLLRVEYDGETIVWVQPSV